MSSINASKLALEAQQYAAAEGDIIRMKPYAELNSSSKAEIAGTHFSKEISVGTESDYTDTIKKKIVTVKIYKGTDTLPCFSLDVPRLSADVKNNGVPIGTVITWASNSNPTENGVWLECNGQSCVAYPALVALVGSNVPNYTGAFLRSYGVRTSYHYGTVTHYSGGLGELQGDAMREIGGWFGGWDVQPSAFSGNGFAIYQRGNWCNQGGYYSDSAGLGIDFYASRCAPVANEIRPLNVAVRYFIKAA